MVPASLPRIGTVCRDMPRSAKTMCFIIYNRSLALSWQRRVTRRLLARSWAVAGWVGVWPIMGLCVPLGFSSADEATLRVLTLNVGGERVDSRLLLQLIQREKPDIVMLQECGKNNVAEMLPQGWNVAKAGHLRVASPNKLQDQQLSAQQVAADAWAVRQRRNARRADRRLQRPSSHGPKGDRTRARPAHGGQPVAKIHPQKGTRKPSPPGGGAGPLDGAVPRALDHRGRLQHAVGQRDLSQLLGTVHERVFAGRLRIRQNTLDIHARGYVRGADRPHSDQRALASPKLLGGARRRLRPPARDCGSQPG